MNDTSNTEVDNKGKKTGKGSKPGSGRTAGSFSFVKISLADLQKKFADTETPVLVSRKWAEAVGFTNVNSARVQDLTGQIEGLTPQTKVAAKIQELE